MRTNINGIGTIIAIKKAKISDFLTLSLNITRTSSFVINPDCNEFKNILKWYKDSNRSNFISKISK